MDAPLIAAAIKRDLESITLGDLNVELPDRTKDTPVFEAVFDSQSLFGTNNKYDLPDLICLPVKGVDVKATLGVDTLSAKDIFTGAHTWDNAFLLARGFSEDDIVPKPSVKDAARLILSKLMPRIILQHDKYCPIES